MYLKFLEIILLYVMLLESTKHFTLIPSARDKIYLCTANPQQASLSSELGLYGLVKKTA